MPLLLGLLALGVLAMVAATSGRRAPVQIGIGRLSSADWADVEAVCREALTGRPTIQAPTVPLADPLARSPLPETDAAGWARFAHALRTGEPSTITPDGRLGMWALSPRRLGELGIMDNVRQVAGPGGRKLWAGEFRAPWTSAAWLADARAQLAALAVEAAHHRKAILADAELRAHLGAPLAGETAPVTLSGMLAIAHVAGISGLKSWLAEPGDRQKFTRTTALFRRATGAF